MPITCVHDPCKHCRTRASSGRGRGLCWTCRHTPGVAALYPPAFRHCVDCGMRLQDNARGWQHDQCANCLRGETPEIVRQISAMVPLVGAGPTAALPGSVERMAVYAVRAARGLPVFDRRDAREVLR